MIKKCLFCMFVFLSQYSFAEDSAAEREDSSIFQGLNFDTSDMKIISEINLATEHSDGTYTDENHVLHDYNEDNELYSLGLKVGTITFGYSYFDNSYFDYSNMISVEHDLINKYDFTLQIGLSLITGYKYEIMQSDWFVGDILVAPLFTFKYSPEFLRYKNLQLSPKIRLMGIDAYMFNLEFAYKL